MTLSPFAPVWCNRSQTGEYFWHSDLNTNKQTEANAAADGPSCANMYLFNMYLLSLLLKLISSLFHLPNTHTHSILFKPEKFIWMRPFKCLNANKAMTKFRWKNARGAPKKHGKHHSNYTRMHLLFFSECVVKQQAISTDKRGGVRAESGQGAADAPGQMKSRGKPTKQTCQQHSQQTPANTISQMHIFIITPHGPNNNNVLAVV